MLSYKKYLESKEEKLYKKISSGEWISFNTGGENRVDFTYEEIGKINNFLKNYTQSGSEIHFTEKNLLEIWTGKHSPFFRILKYKDEWYIIVVQGEYILCDEFKGVVQYLENKLKK